MARAIELSLENIHSGRGGPFAAVVVKDGQIVAEGTNCVTSANDPTAHAEVVAIRTACKRLQSFELTGCEIYTTCEPCPMCSSLAVWANVTTIAFGASIEKTAALGRTRIRIPASEVVGRGPASVEVLEGILEEECLELYR